MYILYIVPLKPSSNLLPIQHDFYYFSNAKRNINTPPPIKIAATETFLWWITWAKDLGPRHLTPFFQEHVYPTLYHAN